MLWNEPRQGSSSQETLPPPTFLHGARIGGGVSSDNVEDAQQLQNVLHPAGVLAAACLGLRRLPGNAKDLATLTGQKRAWAQHAGAAAEAGAVLTHILEGGTSQGVRPGPDTPGLN